MLLNETLCEVFGWFDRRFLETTLRRVSRKSNAIVDRLANIGPKFLASKAILSIACYRKDYNSVHILRSLDSILELPEEDIPRTPLDVGPPPAYFFVEEVDICERVCQCSLEEHRYMRISVFGGDSSSMVSYIIRDPSGGNDVDLFDFAWGIRCVDRHRHSIWSDKAERFSLGLIRTCVEIFQEFSFITSKTILHFSDWLNATIEPSTWKTDKMLFTKHLTLNMISTSEDGLCKLIIEGFKRRIRPLAQPFHLILTITLGRSHPRSNVRRWANCDTHETLIIVEKDSATHVVCRPIDKCALSDFCHDCSYENAAVVETLRAYQPLIGFEAK